MDELDFRVEVGRFSCRAGLLMTASVCTQCTGNSSIRTRQFRELQRSCCIDSPQRPFFLSVPFYLCCPLLSPPSVCLSVALTNPLRLAELHTSCLTARCHVYPGRSALCNLKPLLNTRPRLCGERQLQTKGRCGRMNAARKHRVSRGDKRKGGMLGRLCRIDFTPAARAKTSGANHTQGLQPKAYHFIYNSLCDWLEHSRPQYVLSFPNVRGVASVWCTTEILNNKHAVRVKKASSVSSAADCFLSVFMASHKSSPMCCSCVARHLK